MSDNLFTPLSIGTLQLNNRIVMAPLTRGRAGITRVPNEYMREYYQQRADAGLIIAEATAISEQGYGWFGSPGIYTQEHADGWKNVVNGVHSKGGKIFLQLWHMGRASHSSFNPANEIVAASAIKIPGDLHVRGIHHKKLPFEVPRALEKAELPGIVNDYRNAARLAKDAGFDGVEIHAANGYLLDTFLQSVTNHRTDEYGGSFANRARFLLEVIEGVKAIYPVDRIGVRLSPNGSLNGMGSVDNHEFYPFLGKLLQPIGLAYLHVMDGLSFGYHEQCPPVTIRMMKDTFQGVVMGNVGYTKETAVSSIAAGNVDLIAFGRPFLANPDLVQRFRENIPLNPPFPITLNFGTTDDPADSLDGYLNLPRDGQVHNSEYS